MGGDRLLLPAAAGRARRRARPRHAVGHPGPGRPARGAGRARALRGVPARDPARVAPARHRPHARPGRDRRARVLGGDVRGGAGRSTAAAASRRGSRRTRRGPRRRRIRSCRCWPAPPACACSWRRASPRTARAPVAGAAACGCRSARTRRGSTRCSRRPACARRASISPTSSGTAPRALRPLRSEAGPLLAPIDRALLDLVWSDGGYPSRGAVPRHARADRARHQAWSVDGPAYDPARGAEQARADARDFVARAAARVRGGGLAVVALDTELLGAALARGDAVARRRAGRGGARPACAWRRSTRCSRRPTRRRRPCCPVTSWGAPRNLATWSGPAAGGLAWRQRAAELRASRPAPEPPARALRELLALQASDWAFLSRQRDRGRLPGRARARARGGVRRRAGGPGRAAAELRGLAPHLARRARAALSAFCGASDAATRKVGRAADHSVREPYALPLQ